MDKRRNSKFHYLFSSCHRFPTSLYFHEYIKSEACKHYEPAIINCVFRCILMVFHVFSRKYNEISFSNIASILRLASEPYFFLLMWSVITMFYCMYLERDLLMFAMKLYYKVVRRKFCEDMLKINTSCLNEWSQTVMHWIYICI